MSFFVYRTISFDETSIYLLISEVKLSLLKFKQEQSIKNLKNRVVLITYKIYIVIQMLPILTV